MENLETIAEHIEVILDLLGYDKANHHFLRTPDRVAGWLDSFRANASDQQAAELLEVVFPEVVPETLVIEGPITFQSMCAHHMLPAVGKAWVGYLPTNGICGLSKLARLVDFYARQLTVQERVTNQIANTLDATLKPKGCMVVIRAQHFCMTFRGIKDAEVLTTTSAVRGIHQTSASARAEFLSLMEQR